MATTFKWGVEEGVNDFGGCRIVDKSGRKSANICVVVCTSESGEFWYPAQDSPNPLVFVKRDGHPFAASTKSDTRRDFSFFDRFGQRMGIVWIVAPFRAVTPEVVYLVSQAVEIAHQKFFHFIACVVAGNPYFRFVGHCAKICILSFWIEIRSKDSDFG